MTKAGILERAERGKYHLAHKDENPLAGGLSDVNS